MTTEEKYQINKKKVRLQPTKKKSWLQSLKVKFVLK